MSILTEIVAMENIFFEFLCLVVYVTCKRWLSPYKYYTAIVHTPMEMTDTMCICYEKVLNTGENNLRYHKRSNVWEVKCSRLCLDHTPETGSRIVEIEYWEAIYGKQVDQVKGRLARKKVPHVSLA